MVFLSSPLQIPQICSPRTHSLTHRFLLSHCRNNRTRLSDTGYGRSPQWCPQLYCRESSWDAAECPEAWTRQHTPTTDHRQSRPCQTGERLDRSRGRVDCIFVSFQEQLTSWILCLLVVSLICSSGHDPQSGRVRKMWGYVVIFTSVFHSQTEPCGSCSLNPWD